MGICKECGTELPNTRMLCRGCCIDMLYDMMIKHEAIPRRMYSYAERLDIDIPALRKEAIEDFYKPFLKNEFDV